MAGFSHLDSCISPGGLCHFGTCVASMRNPVSDHKWSVRNNNEIGAAVQIREVGIRSRIYAKSSGVFLVFVEYGESFL